MPATEQTWYSTKRLHLVFGITSVLLLISTIWMFLKDYNREWKPYQAKFREVEMKMTSWREFQYQASQIEAERDRLEAKLKQIRGSGLNAKWLERFQALAAEDADFTDFDRWKAELEDLATKSREAATKLNEAQLAYDEARLAADDATQAAVAANQAAESAAAAAAADPEKAAAAETAKNTAKKQRVDAEAAASATSDKLAEARKASADADEAATPTRNKLVAFMDDVIERAEFQEELASKNRKFRMADYDAAVARLGLGVSAGAGEQEQQRRQSAVSAIKEDTTRLTGEWEQLKRKRENLQRAYTALTAEENEVLEAMKQNEAGLDALDTAKKGLRVNFFQGPFPGKRWLELPILDAFNSPLKIDNLWADGLEQEYGSFGNVRRFDRCTTCHRGMESTLPGSATDPAYINRHTIQLALPTQPPEGVDLEPPAEADTELKRNIATVSAAYGLHFASQGLLEPGHVTVAYVTDKSLGAQAAVIRSGTGKQTGAAIESQLLRLQPDDEDARPGLRVGDVIAEINGATISSEGRAVQMLADAIGGAPLRLTVSRGLPSPYSTHPRLDLFVGSLSPHKVSDFACTVCHEGQGSATDFKWASHAPNDPEQEKAWRMEHGWFDNHHWIFPMNPMRFVESVCLKCHHDVTELRPSEKFPEPPAPNLMHGYDLVTKYGCYGCHDINGHDGPKRVGPDLRSEPNYFSVAQMLQAKPGFADLPESLQRRVGQLAHHPEDDALRHAVIQGLKEDGLAETPALDESLRELLDSLLADIEAPGKLRRAGPALRFLATKSDRLFNYDWVKEPANFRPSTRMPQFFGHWKHLADPHSLALSQELEPMEIYSAVDYLMQASQPQDYLDPPEGVTPLPAGEAALAEKIERGKVLFQERGCLACHSHPDFADMSAFRAEGQIQQGPDLGGLGSKFDLERNPNGRRWLYSWIKEPTRYHVRTVMPNLFLDPIEVQVKTPVEGQDEPQVETIVIDPVDDIVEYLLTSLNEQWTPAPAPNFATAEAQTSLDNLIREHLADAFIASEVDVFLAYGVPKGREADLKDAEKLLVVPNDNVTGQVKLPLETKLRYAGFKTIAKFGCYGCHDIPGFEGAKNIGAGLAEWGRKESGKLAFEHIHQYLHGAHGHGGPGGEDGHQLTREQAAELVGNVYRDPEHDEHGEPAAPATDKDGYFNSQLNAGNRIGFLYQKLREPRSYDYQKTRNKKYNDRLRMPMFPFQDGEREAVMTFVLGLVADPPSAKYVFKPDERTRALMEGKKVLEKYNCAGCHMLEPQQWQLEFPSGAVGAQSAKATYPFIRPQFTPQQVEASQQANRRNRMTATLTGMPFIKPEGVPELFTNLEDRDAVQAGDRYDLRTIAQTFDIWMSALVEGKPYRPGQTRKAFEGAYIHGKTPAHGGDLARYLISRVGKRARQPHALDHLSLWSVTPGSNVREIWGWLPPPLHHQGEKVQTEWLHNFLLEPFAIRPATVLRMPKFNMSPEEATKLVNYFAAKNNVSYPYSYSASRDPARLERRDQQYREAHGGEPGERLRHAMQIVTSGTYCIKCHNVADAKTSAALRARAPNLAGVYERLRPDYLRNWIAEPASVLPYTAMPPNVAYDPNLPMTGTTVSQDLYHGDSTQQVDALVDLLMNYDQYARQESKVAPLVKAAADAEAAKKAAAEAAKAEAAKAEAAKAEAAKAEAAKAEAAAANSGGDD